VSETNASTDQKDKWKEQYGQIAEAKLGNVELCFRPPELDEWERCQNKLATDSKEKAVHIRSLTQQVLLSPDRDTYAKLLERYPGFPLKLFDTLGDLVGGSTDIVVKKG
jgi:hypothetical protein